MFQNKTWALLTLLLRYDVGKRYIISVIHHYVWRNSNCIVLYGSFRFCVRLAGFHLNYKSHQPFRLRMKVHHEQWLALIYFIQRMNVDDTAAREWPLLKCLERRWPWWPLSLMPACPGTRGRYYCCMQTGGDKDGRSRWEATEARIGKCLSEWTRTRRSLWLKEWRCIY